MVAAFEHACGKEIPYEIVDRRPGDVAVSYADPSKAGEELGWEAVRGIDAMCADSGMTIGEVRADGGAANNDMLMQFQADVLNVPVVRPQVTETTALGAAYLAGNIHKYLEVTQAKHEFVET